MRCSKRPVEAMRRAMAVTSATGRMDRCLNHQPAMIESSAAASAEIHNIWRSPLRVESSMCMDSPTTTTPTC